MLPIIALLSLFFLPSHAEGETLSLDFDFQRVKAGSFVMGSPASEKGRYRNEDQRHVVISKDFDMMTTEVTQMQWFGVMGFNPSQFKTQADCDNHVIIKGEQLCPDHPVERVSWGDVHAYIESLNEKAGPSGCHGTSRDPSGCYRLPTEEEWEFAARGGAKTRYFFGNDASVLDDYAWYKKNSGRRTHPVGLKRANPFGLYDMSGNVWEWVQGDGSKNLPCVIRGGSWFSNARKLRSAHHRTNSWGSMLGIVGFRLVRTK